MGEITKDSCDLLDLIQVAFIKGHDGGRLQFQILGNRYPFHPVYSPNEQFLLKSQGLPVIVEFELSSFYFSICLRYPHPRGKMERSRGSSDFPGRPFELG